MANSLTKLAKASFISIAAIIFIIIAIGIKSAEVSIPWTPETFSFANDEICEAIGIISFGR